VAASTASLGVVGGANVDLVVRCRSLPSPGETVLGDDLVRLAGGKGANQAVAASRLGVSTSFVGCVGEDAHGEWLLDNFARHGVMTTYVSSSARPTGTALIAVDDRGENLIVVSAGANLEISLAGVPLEEFDVVLAQLETPVRVVAEVAERARALVLNAAPAIELDPRLLARCAVVIANEAEAEALDVAALSRCVLTLGARGARYLEHGVERASAAPPPVAVVDAVGAGDVLCAAFAIRFLAGDTPAEALAYAVTAGALATRAEGAQGALPTDEEVRTWLRAS
jgi:ribokinase